MAALKTWKSFDGAAAAALRQSDLTHEAYVIVTGHTRRDFTICPLRNLGPDRARRSVGLVSADGVVTPGRVHWDEQA